ncbi:MAG: hypothetical protein AB1797_13120, partial [bacterium]
RSLRSRRPNKRLEPMLASASKLASARTAQPPRRYDTAHGFAHLDRMHPDDSVEKVPLSYWDYNEALSFAQFDIKSNWEWYRKRYEKEIKQ